MSVYESIAKKQVKIKQRLFDEQVTRLGQEMRVLRLRGKEDIWQDMKDISIISKEFIPVIIRFPDEIPLERYRADSSELVEDTRVFFFDLLPTEIYTKISDNVEVRDILFFEIKDENCNRIPFLLQVTETFGKLDFGLVWKKSYAAPQHGALTKEIYDDLTEYYYSETDPETIFDPEEIDPLLRKQEDKDLVMEKRYQDILG